MIVIILLFTLGAVLASFIFVLLEEERFDLRFLLRRSACNNCQQVISTAALVPIFGYFINHRKCKKCNKKVPSYYFYSEITLALAFILPLISYIQFRDLNLYYLLMIFLVPLAIYDFKYFKIPDAILTVLLICGLYITQFNYFNFYIDILIIVLSHLFYHLFKNQIGYGDIKLICVLTLITPTLMFSYIILFSYIIGGFFIIILEIFKSIHINKLPYVPFVATSTIITFLIYDDLSIIYYGGFL